MPSNKIGGYGNLADFGADVATLGDRLAAARVEVEEAEDEVRRLSWPDAEKAAEAADRALHDEAYARGDDLAGIGTPHVDALKADRLRAEARLRAARIAEAEADSDLYEALQAAKDRAIDPTVARILETAAHYRQLFAALEPARRAFLGAVEDRRFIDTLRAAEQFERKVANGEPVTMRDVVWPVSRRDNAGTGRIRCDSRPYVDIDFAGLLAFLEADITSNLPAVAEPAPDADDDTSGYMRSFKSAGRAPVDEAPAAPSADNRFNRDVPKPGRRRTPRAAAQ